MTKILGVCSYNLNFGSGFEIYSKVECLAFYGEINSDKLIRIIGLNTCYFWFSFLTIYFMDFKKLFCYRERRMLNFLDCSCN